jgi:CTP:molybdopterin cytidylyltransferase MocA
VPGRELKGVHFALEFLIPQNKEVAGDGPTRSTSRASMSGHRRRRHRLRLRRHLQPPRRRQHHPDRTAAAPPEQENGELTWPYWPLKMRTSSSHDEGCARDWAIGTKEFIGEKGKLKAVKAVRLEWKDGRMSEIAGSEFEIPADYVFLAMGFVSPVGGVLDAFGVDKDNRGNASADTEGDQGCYATSVQGRVRRRRHAPRPVAGGLGHPRRPPVRAQRRPVPDGLAPPCRAEPALNVVILAAGKGKRMHSDLPKVLHPLAGKPLLAHVIDSARELGAEKICVVHGHGGEQVRAALDAPDLAWALQEPQLGTGHAVLQALPHLAVAVSPAPTFTLVLYGDVPLTRASTLRRLIERPAATSWRCSPHTSTIRRAMAASCAWMAARSCASSKRRMPTMPSARSREINTGILVAPTAALARWLPDAGQPQRAGRVLPDRHRRHGSQRRHAGGDRASRCRLGNRGREQQAATGGAGARAPAQHRRSA